MAAAGRRGPSPCRATRSWCSAAGAARLAAARGCADCGWKLARRGLAEHAHLAPPELLLALGALGWTVALGGHLAPLSGQCWGLGTWGGPG